MKPSKFLAALLICSFVEPTVGQNAQVVTATWSPTGVSWPLWTWTILSPGPTTTVPGSICFAKYSGTDVLIGVDMQIAWVVGGSFSGTLNSGGGFTAVTTDLLGTVVVSPGCAPNLSTAANSITTVNSGGSPIIGIAPLNQGTSQTPNVSLPPTCFSLFQGPGQLCLPIQGSFLQRVYPSSGSITGRYALGGGATVATLSVTYRTAPAATATMFGAGCAGSSGIPQMAAVGLPRLGNAGFGFAISVAAPQSAAAPLVSFAAGNMSLGGGCTLFVDQNQFVSLPLTLTSALGTAQMSYPIPTDTNLLGCTLVGQAGILDAQGAYQGVAAFTGGVALRIGV